MHYFFHWDRTKEGKQEEEKEEEEEEEDEEEGSSSGRRRGRVEVNVFNVALEENN